MGGTGPVPAEDRLADVMGVLRRPDLKLRFDSVDALLVDPDEFSRPMSDANSGRTSGPSLRRVVLALLACFAVVCAVAIYGLGTGTPHGTTVRAPLAPQSR